MNETFKDIKFKDKSLRMIEECNQIIQTYTESGLRLTLRQLYYQLVSTNAIVNSEKSYKTLGKLVSDARLAGLIDWYAIEDRGRRPRIPSEFKTLEELVETAIHSFRLPRWNGQEYYVELWIEKQALEGIFAPIASKYHITLSVNKGYASQSAMYEAAQRIIYGQNRGFELNEDGSETNVDDLDQDPRNAVVLYLGDHDPSGEDMVRDIEDRLVMFGVKDLEVQKVALTSAQVKQYKPPPNPAKLTDSRAQDYIAIHGPHCWEVDALPPKVLNKLVEQAIAQYVNMRLMDKVKTKEEEGKERLRLAGKGM